LEHPVPKKKQIALEEIFSRNLQPDSSDYSLVHKASALILQKTGCFSFCDFEKTPLHLTVMTVSGLMIEL
jgi:hypothetical protein